MSEQKSIALGKQQLELHFTESGIVYLNFWNWDTGRDVVAEVKDDGSLVLPQHDEDFNDLPCKKITFGDYVALVKEALTSA